MRPVGVRWTIGDVSERGFRALQLSVWGAWRLFGPDARYCVCVNSISLDTARLLTGPVPDAIEWRDVSAEVPGFLSSFINQGMAEGVAWKFAPLRVFPDRYELALDNDCILWTLPAALRHWLEGADPAQLVLAADVRPCFGQFAPLCGDEPRNSGIRGLPPAFDLESALTALLRTQSTTLVSELDEQGLQVAALRSVREPLVVTTDEVTICSPFPPHLPFLGRCGAHFVGLNSKRLPWDYYGTPASELTARHFDRLRPQIAQRLDLAVREVEDEQAVP